MKKGFVFGAFFILFFITILLFVIPEKVNENFSEKIYCTEEQRNAESCIQIYKPVCGYVGVDCITEPCDPVPETFPNECVACANERVEYYLEGECQ